MAAATKKQVHTMPADEESSLTSLGLPKQEASNAVRDKKLHKGYTGPPMSRFAPPKVRDEL